MKLALGVVTFNNSTTQLERLLTSINRAYAEARCHHEFTVTIFAVNNGSPCFDEAQQRVVLKEGIAARLLETAGNIGFGRAQNQLMREAFADNEAYLAVNPDGLFHHACLNEILNAAQRWNDALLEAKQFPEENAKLYDSANGDTDWATGACLYVPRIIYEAIGGFDDNLFMYSEDVDFSWRARAAGFRIKLVENALFCHATLARKWSPLAKKHFFLSAVYLVSKWGQKEDIEFFEQEYLKRFNSQEDKEDLEALMDKAVTARTTLPVNRHFQPQFQKSMAFSKARWNY